MKSIFKFLSLALIMALAMPANAQFGNIGNRIKNSAKNKVQNEVYKAAQNPGKVIDDIKSNTASDSNAKSSGSVMINQATFKWDGKINHDTWNKSQKSTVTFSRFPASLDEFIEVREAIGKEPQGAVALVIMAMELYHRDKDEGKEALKLINTSTNYSSMFRQLKEVMGDDASYARPYLPAALLKGANPKNAYTPDSPYQVKVRVNPVTKYQESELLDGIVIYLQVDSEGWDTNWRGIEVVKPDGEEYYLVSNCPAFYTQCKKIKGTYQGLK